MAVLLRAKGATIKSAASGSHFAARGGPVNNKTTTAVLLSTFKEHPLKADLCHFQTAKKIKA